MSATIVTLEEVEAMIESLNSVNEGLQELKIRLTPAKKASKATKAAEPKAKKAAAKQTKAKKEASEEPEEEVEEEEPKVSKKAAKQTLAKQTKAKAEPEAKKPAKATKPPKKEEIAEEDIEADIVKVGKKQYSVFMKNHRIAMDEDDEVVGILDDSGKKFLPLTKEAAKFCEAMSFKISTDAEIEKTKTEISKSIATKTAPKTTKAAKKEPSEVEEDEDGEADVQEDEEGEVQEDEEEEVEEDDE